VPGKGHQQADVVIIGEAPGHDEDIQGLPFVGRAGQLLGRMLQAIDIDPQQVYITNILKCRPPQNRDPKTEEVAACSRFLQAQIKLIQPKVIFSVGRISAQNLLQVQTPVGKLRGQQHVLPHTDIPLLVSYHPAYLLRNPAEKSKVWQDLKALHQLLQHAAG
jgi:DNA polymerase